MTREEKEGAAALSRGGSTATRPALLLPPPPLPAPEAALDTRERGGWAETETEARPLTRCDDAAAALTTAWLALWRRPSAATVPRATPREPADGDVDAVWSCHAPTTEDPAAESRLCAPLWVIDPSAAECWAVDAPSAVTRAGVPGAGDGAPAAAVGTAVSRAAPEWLPASGAKACWLLDCETARASELEEPVFSPRARDRATADSILPAPAPPTMGDAMNARGVKSADGGPRAGRAVATATPAPSAGLVVASAGPWPLLFSAPEWPDVPPLTLLEPPRTPLPPWLPEPAALPLPLPLMPREGLQLRMPPNVGMPVKEADALPSSW
mmetsp:Transcript_18928/g.72204  ORF Transcript_18928/g.72204 Transcript_18928/m.72204 type:complete len:326 (+) Transcript_18928:1633-2610(+)